MLNRLSYLQCSTNQLAELDVSMHKRLSSLKCSANQLTELDVSKLTALISLECSGNQLTELDVSMLTTLWILRCSGNQLTSLNLTGLPIIEFDGISQTPNIAMTRNSASVKYETPIALNNPTFLNKGLTYANGKLIAGNNSIDTTSFAVETGLAGKTIEGRLYLAYKTGTAVEAAALPALKAVAEGGSILISGLSAGGELKVYNISGRLVYNARPADGADLRIAVERGVYIVVFGKSTVKVVAE
jgi:hypothetical protein